MTHKSFFTGAMMVAVITWGITASCGSDHDVMNENEPDTTEEQIGETSDGLSDNLEITGKENSGCLTRGESYQIPSIVLTKEGDAVTVEILGFISNCATTDFNLTPLTAKGQDGSDTLTVGIMPVIAGGSNNCYCPYNITFTVRGVLGDKFYLSCDWFSGDVDFAGKDRLDISYEVTSVIIGGLKYELKEHTCEAMLENGNSWDGHLDIPATVEHEGRTYTVTRISWLAFNACPSLTGITIPKTVREIFHSGNYEACKNPFDDCTALESIEVDKDNRWMCSDSGVLFSKDRTWLYAYPGGSMRTEYVVPDGVETICGNAFSGNRNLKSIRLPLTVNKLFFGVFSGCTNLEEVNLPENLNNIAAYMFNGCTGLKSVRIPQSVTSIAEQVFVGCSSLTEIEIPEHLTTIGSLAFMNCTGLKKIVLPKSLSSLTTGIFKGCSSLTNVTIHNVTSAIEANAFTNCYSLRELDLPASISSIERPFGGCSLDRLIIRGHLTDSSLKSRNFDGIGEKTVLYVPATEIERFKAVYQGTVLPLTSIQQ